MIYAFVFDGGSETNNDKVCNSISVLNVLVDVYRERVTHHGLEKEIRLDGLILGGICGLGVAAGITRGCHPGSSPSQRGSGVECCWDSGDDRCGGDGGA